LAHNLFKMNSAPITAIPAGMKKQDLQPYRTIKNPFKNTTKEAPIAQAVFVIENLAPLSIAEKTTSVCHVQFLCFGL